MINKKGQLNIFRLLVIIMFIGGIILLIVGGWGFWTGEVTFPIENLSPDELLMAGKINAIFAWIFALMIFSFGRKIIKVL